MPAHVELQALRALVKDLGERLAHARKARNLPAAAVARQLGISRNTLAAAERGDSSVTIGTYCSILGVYGLAEDLALVAADAKSQGDVVAKRHAALEAEVAVGKRDARSLVAIPEELAKTAHVAFPKDAFGKAKAW